jgi:hypothetical protein
MAPPSSSHVSGPVALNIYRRFQELAGLSLPSHVFLGLCAYLYALVGWHWPLPAERFDSFICSYAVYKDLGHVTASYHTWFLQLPQPGRYSILDRATLERIAAENPYTFALTRESLCAIARRHGAAAPSPAPVAALPPMPPRAATPATPPTALALPPQPPDLTSLQPWHDERALRKALGVRDRDELLAWVRQDWVFAIYEEYYTAVLSQWQAGRPDLHPGVRGSSATFIVNSSLAALHSYTLPVQDRSRWTQDQHDIRLVSRLVAEGQQPDRWWERHGPGETPTLCITAYRFLCWLRHIHRLAATQGAGSQLQRAVDCRWFTELQEERTRRARASGASASAIDGRQ